MTDEIIISPRMITALDDMLAQKREIHVTQVFDNIHLTRSNFGSLAEFEEKIVAPRLAHGVANALKDVLVEQSILGSSKPERFVGTATKYDVHIAFLTSEELTLLHRIKNTLAAKFLEPKDYF